MLGIEKFARDKPQAIDKVGEEYMFELDAWSPEKAVQDAAAEGITLTDEHWVVINILRERYRAYGQASSARALTAVLEHEFSHGQGRQRLYELFPGGPVSQGCKIAGLPLPPYSSDPSFGSFQ